MLIPDDAFCTFESVAEQRSRARSGRDAWEVESSGESEVTGVRDADRGRQRQTSAFLKDGVRPSVMFCLDVFLHSETAVLRNASYYCKITHCS